MFSPEIEQAKREDIRALQLARLKATVAYAYERVPMYKKRFDEIGLKPEHIRTFADMRHIPYTTKDDLRDNYPFGLFAVPMKKTRSATPTTALRAAATPSPCPSR